MSASTFAQLSHATRIAVSFALLLTAILKLSSRHTADLLLPMPAHYGVAVAELVLAVLLVADKHSHLAMFAVFGLCLAGAAAAMSSTASCGCLGSAFQLTRAQHLTLAGAIGLAAATHLISLKPTNASQ